MSHIAVRLICDEETAETVSFLLQEIQFSGTSYENGELTAYCPEYAFDPEALELILSRAELKPKSVLREEDQNWNELWESNFKDIQMDDVHIRAPFHPSNDSAYEIVIHPKMAFGTGHHATTQLMLKALKDLDVHGKRVLDMGCGSGILAVFASKLGASDVLAIDNDPSSIENTLENVQLNQRSNVTVLQAEELGTIDKNFDIILSNIIKLVNLDLLPEYNAKLIPGGYLLLSGMLPEDKVEVIRAAEALNLHLDKENEDTNWLQLTLRKP